MWLYIDTFAYLLILHQVAADLQDANKANGTSPSSQLSRPSSKCSSQVSLVDSVSVLGTSDDSLAAPLELSPLEIAPLELASSELSALVLDPSYDSAIPLDTTRTMASADDNLITSSPLELVEQELLPQEDSSTHLGDDNLVTTTTTSVPTFDTSTILITNISMVTSVTDISIENSNILVENSSSLDKVSLEQEVKNSAKGLGDLDPVDTSNSPTNVTKDTIVIDFNKRLQGRLDVSGIMLAIKNKYRYIHEGLDTKKSKYPIKARHSIPVNTMPEPTKTAILEIPLIGRRRVAVKPDHGEGLTQTTRVGSVKSKATTKTKIPAPSKKSSSKPRISGRKFPLNSFCRVDDVTDLSIRIAKKPSPLATINRRAKYGFIDYEMTLPVEKRSRIPITKERRNSYSDEERRAGFVNPIYVQSNTPLSVETISEYRDYSKIDIGVAIRSYAAVIKALFPALGTFTKVNGVTELAGVFDVQLALHRLEKASTIRLQRQMPANGVTRNRLIHCMNYCAVELYLGVLDEVSFVVSKVTDDLARYYAGLRLPCCHDNEESATDAHRITSGVMICINRIILKTFSGGKVVCSCRICDRVENCSCAVNYRKGMLTQHTLTDISYYFTLYIFTLFYYILIFMNTHKVV